MDDIKGDGARAGVKSSQCKRLFSEEGVIHHDIDEKIQKIFSEKVPSSFPIRKCPVNFPTSLNVIRQSKRVAAIRKVDHTMLTLDLKGDLGIMLFDTATPRNDFDTGLQRVDEETGLPQWSVAVLLRQEDARRAEPINITVLAKEDPNESFEYGDKVIAENIICRTGAAQNGGNWVSFTADAIKPAPAKGAAAPKPAEAK